MVVDPYTAAFAVKTFASVLGGQAQKAGAKKKAGLMREGILMRRGFQLEDQARGGRELMSGIQAAEGASGARGSSGSFKEHEQSEIEKQAESRSRIMAGSELELKKVASGLRAEVKAANLASTFGALDAAAGYYASEYEASPTTLPEAV